jgi:hypothetical protein
LNWQKKTFEAKTNYPGFGSAPFKMEIEIYWIEIIAKALEPTPAGAAHR